MPRVLCTVDESPAAREAVRAAVAFCRENDAELELVGMVKPSFFDPPQPSCGERVRRYRQVQYELTQAAEAAHEAGLEPEITIRTGDPAAELLREADGTSAGEIFLARGRGPIWAALTGQPRVKVVRVSLAAVTRPAAERAVRKVA